MHHWAMVWDGEHYTVMGPYNSHTQAQGIVDRLGSIVEYNIEEIDTLSKGKATSYLKAIEVREHPERFQKARRVRHPKEATSV